MSAGTGVPTSGGAAALPSSGVDFFVSYTGSDEAWATWVAEVLEAEGCTVAVQVWDSPAGENFVAWISRQMAAAGRTVALCSEAYFASHWCTQEWTGALAEQTLTPLRVADCRIPPVLSTVVYRDLHGIDETEARRRVLEAVGLVTPARRSGGFPGSPPPAPALASVGAAFPGQSGPARNLFFTGRADTGGVDFFVSYIGVDRDWATWIAGVLETAGYRVLLQDWDVAAATNWLRQMQVGIAWPARTIAVFSNDYLRSVSTRAEWQAAWAADPDGTARTLIAVRIVDCERPELLRNVASIDLFGLTDDAAKTELLTKIEAARVGRDTPWTPPDRLNAHEPAPALSSLPPRTFPATTGLARITTTPSRAWSPGRVVAEILAGVVLLTLVAGGITAQSAGRGGAVGIVAGVVAVGFAISVVILVLRATVTARPVPAATAWWALVLGLVGAVIGWQVAAVVSTGHGAAAVLVEVVVAALLAGIAVLLRSKGPAVEHTGLVSLKAGGQEG